MPLGTPRAACEIRRRVERRGAGTRGGGGDLSITPGTETGVQSENPRGWGARPGRGPTARSVKAASRLSLKRIKIAKLIYPVWGCLPG